MKTVLFIVVMLVFTFGCLVGESVTPEAISIPMLEVDYLPAMALLSNATLQTLQDATELVRFLSLDDPLLVTGLKQKSTKMGEIYDEAVLITPPPRFVETHNLFIEAVQLYRDGLTTAAYAIEFKDEEQAEITGALMDAGDEKIREAAQKIREMQEVPY